jgi:GH15 family glucan-1,4-alpha-glucosidase
VKEQHHCLVGHDVKAPVKLPLFALLLAVPCAVFAQPTPPRTFFSLSSSNGHGAVMVDARTAKIVHFREHLPATEEPQLDAMGREVWVGNQPQMVKTRDVLFDAYFGLRAGGQQRWLTSAPISSGYLTAAPSPRSGSGIITWEHTVFGLEATTYVFAPRSLPQASFVMAMRLRNSGNSTIAGVSAFSLQNFHLGSGRPGVMQELPANGETIVIGANRDVLERAFAGVVVARPVGTTSRVAAWNPSSSTTQNAFRVVDQTTGDLTERTGDLGVAEDWASAFQFDVGDLPAGEERWVAVVVAHHGDPFGGTTVQDWLSSYVNGRSAQELVDAERTDWETFQSGLKVPAGLSMDELAVLRQSAVVLEMAQVKAGQAFLREFLSRDGEPRLSRFRATDGGARLPATIVHRGAGAVLASLPPGEWTYSWIRDGAYAASAMALLGLTSQSSEALRFYLDAEGGRFQNWDELKSYSLPPYIISLTRYVGFGVEETDFNDFGPNLEFDGFGLFLWALRQHELRTQDTSLSDARWNDIATKVADPLVALIDPTTGLMRKDSSIWETHWNGRERTWTYTSLTAARGLCDAAAIATRKQDPTRAMRYRLAAQALRRAIAEQLTDASGALASNREELVSGIDYFDAAVFDAMALGLFAPGGRIGRATTLGLERLRVAAGPGWSRNDDRRDHAGRTDLSGWGSEYDSAEWVITDLRGAMVLRAQGDAPRADALLSWVTRNAVANADLIPETFDETTGAWKFNAPMVGFGAGVYALALAQRATGTIEPACDEFFDESVLDAGVDTAVDAGVDAGASAQPDAGTTTPKPPKGCGCSAMNLAVLIPLAMVLAFRRTRRRSVS